MRDPEARLVDLLLPVNQQVEIDGPRALGRDSRAVAAEAGLDGEEEVEVAPAGFQPADEQPTSPIGDQLWMDVADEWQEGREVRDDDADVQVPEPAGRITIQSRPEPEEDDVFASSHSRREERQTTAIDAGERIHRRFNELLDARPRERQNVADRIAYLFPRPEPTEWNVREVSYDRRRRAEPQNELRAS